ncbi:hypothetical protein S14_231 [Shewanella sp. phage 1/4]|uniref:hypothetical protein n=1 Tax=Shewanella phage 1/4 TaxID=1458859 RepID=UPI0004F92D2A|nr:hypothetical protein S14_231 [Shewanella sp. phage 1/4]AHK11340.1 hypothetical protein S14_231 [Shewanella sp. phage 1/4]
MLIKGIIMLNKNKLYPNNSHMNNYYGWLYLGNDGKQDHYIVRSKFAFNASGVWLSIVYSDEPSDYASPCYDHLLKHGDGGFKDYQTILGQITQINYNDIPVLDYD